MASSFSSYLQASSSKIQQSQCSPPNNFDNHRHHQINAYSNPHRSHRVDMPKSHYETSKFKLSSLKGKSWSAFADAYASESSEFFNF